jgi:type III restriction enzyme
MTQLVGRILRQPHAQKTNVPMLDESYVIAHHANTADVVGAIKQGLEEDGMGDLVKEIRVSDPGSSSGARVVQRRNAFAKTEIYLPLVLRAADGQVRPLDYEEDILFALDWQGLDVSSLVNKIPVNASSAEHQMRRIRLADSGEERIVAEVVEAAFGLQAFDMAYAVRMISDIVPNAWWSRTIVGQVVSGLETRGFDTAKLGALSGLVVEELRKWLEEKRNEMAETLFRAEVAAGRVQFRLRTDKHNWRMPFEAETYEPEGADQLLSNNGGPLERSLFSPIYRGDFSSQDERDIAVYLDGENALKWWHRNVARSHYSIQGWRKDKVYPDFIFAAQPDGEANKLVVLEMKGKHLAGNDDTEYKKSVLQLMSSAFSVEHVERVGELELVVEDGTALECDLVLMPEWKINLPKKIRP